MNFRAPEVTPVAFRRSTGALFPNNGTNVEGDDALYTGVQVAAFIAAALAAAKQEWLAELSYAWTCRHTLGGLSCDNHQPHKGDGLGCTHSASDAPDRHSLTEPKDD